MPFDIYRDRNDKDDGGRYYAVVADYSRNRLYIARNSEQIYNYELAEDTSDNPRNYNSEYFMEYGGDGTAYDSNSTPMHNTISVSAETYPLPEALEKFYADSANGTILFHNQRGENSTENPRLPLVAVIPASYPDTKKVGWQYLLLPELTGTENKPAFGFDIGSEDNLKDRRTYAVQSLLNLNGVVNVTDVNEYSFVDAAGYLCFNTVGKTRLMPFVSTQFTGVKQVEAISVRSAEGVVEAAAILYKKDDGWYITSTNINGTTHGKIVEQLPDGNYRIALKRDYLANLKEVPDNHPIQDENPLDVSDTAKMFTIYRIGGPASELESEFQVVPPSSSSASNSSGASTASDEGASTPAQPDLSVSTGGRLLTNTELTPSIPASEKRTRAQLYEALTISEKYGDRTIRPSKYEANVPSIGYDSFSHEKIPEWAKELSQGELVSLVKALVGKILANDRACNERIKRIQEAAPDRANGHRELPLNIIIGGYGYDH